MGEYTFQNCLNLTTINISSNSSITIIPSYFLYNTPKLTNFVIQNSVTTINSYAFYSCGLSVIILPNNITNINSYAFANNSDLSDITLPINSNFNSIANNLFENCINLTVLQNFENNLNII